MFLKNSTIAPLFQYILFILFIIMVGLSIYYLIYIGNKHVEEKNKLKINWTFILKVLIFVLLIVIILSLYRSFKILGNTTFAFFISVIVAFLLNPIVKKLENLGVKRSLGIIISYILILAVFMFLIISLVPVLIEQTTVFMQNLPESINSVTNSINQSMAKLNINPAILDNVKNNINNFISGLTDNLPAFTKNVVNVLQGSFSTAVVFILIPIMSFFILNDKEKILRAGYNFIPKKYRDDALYLYKEINFGMSEFIRSRLLMALFVGVSTWILLELFGLPFALVIGLLTLICDIIPYIGPILATTPALIFAFIKSPIVFLWVGIGLFVLQWIEQNIIGPKLMSGSSGIHEIVVLISIIIGGGIFGVWGMVLAIPTVILINTLIDFSKQKMMGIQPVFTKEKEEIQRRKKIKRKVS